jgi:DNA-binding transcriptional regulator/RsmH inhibitor MraZ
VKKSRLVGPAHPNDSPMPDTAQTSGLLVFMREHRNAVDAQWRVTVPANWRFTDRANFYIRKKRDHLAVLPPAEIERFKAWADALPGPDRVAAYTEWGRTTDDAKLDSAGRLTLPAEWAEEVGIAKSSKVVMVGAFNHFQVWAESRQKLDETGMQKRGATLLAGFD